MTDPTPMDAPAAQGGPSEPIVREATDPDGTAIVVVSLHGPSDEAQSAKMTLDREEWLRVSAEFGNLWGRKGCGKFRYVAALSGSSRQALQRIITGAPSGAFIRFMDYNKLNFRRKNLQVVKGPEAEGLIEKAAATRWKRRGSWRAH